MLSTEEKAVGRVFRDAAQAELVQSFEIDPPDHTVPVVISVYRHACPRRQGRSTALELKEIYLYSPAGGDVPAGRFGFLYKQGRCRYCGASARSRLGRLVDGYDRPPLSGRVAR